MEKLTRVTAIIVWSFMLLFAFTVSAGAASKPIYKKTVEEYHVPDVSLLRQDGEKIQLQSYLNSGKPVILDFIYGTCTTICPVLSVSFSYLQKKLGDEKDNVMLVSISIDPDNDTPELMKQHLEKYGAMQGWDALTGKRSDVVAVLKEFDAYVSNKMDHFPLTLIRGAGEEKWVRLYGLLSASDLLKEYNMLKK